MKRTMAVAGMVLWLAAQSTALAAEPAPATPAAPAASLAADLLKYAPPGTWAVLLVDCAALRSALLGDVLPPPTRAHPTRIGVTVDKVEAFTVFVLPAKGPLDTSSPPVCGVVKLTPEAHGLFEKDPAGLTKIFAGGRYGYAARDGSTRFVFADDQTVVWGDSAASFDAILKACGAPVGPSARLAELLKSGEGDAVRGALAFPQDLRAMLSPRAVGDVPPSWLGATAASLNVGVGKDLRVNLRLLMANPTDAANAAAMETTFVQSAKDLSREVLRQLYDVPWYGDPFSPLALERIDTQAVGTELRVALSFSEEDVRRLQQNVAYSLEQAKKAAPQMNLHLIGLAIELYRLDHNNEHPPDLGLLVAEGHLQRKDELLDPSDTKPVRIGANGPPCSFGYIGPLPRGAPPGTIIAYTRKGIYPDGRNVLYEDVAVTWVSEADLHDPKGTARKSLRASCQALMDACGADMSDEQKARLKVFYEIE